MRSAISCLELMYGNLYFPNVTGELCGDVGRFPGVVGFSFSGLYSHASYLKLEGRLPRPGGMVDGKCFCLFWLTNLRKTKRIQ